MHFAFPQVMGIVDSTGQVFLRCWEDVFIRGSVLLVLLTKGLPCFVAAWRVDFDVLRDKCIARYSFQTPTRRKTAYTHRCTQRACAASIVVFDLFLLGVTRTLGPWSAVVLACLASLNMCIGLLIALKMAYELTQKAPEARGVDSDLKVLLRSLESQMECEVVNRYQDLITPPELLLAIFAAQTMLLLLLLQSIGAPLLRGGEEMTSRMHHCRALGVLIQMAADSQLGAEWGGSEGPYWFLLLLRTRARDRAHSIQVETSVPGVMADMEHLCRPEVLLRCLCSLLVNQVFRGILRTIIPLVLVRTHDDMSFVKDAVAVLFIVLLDDLPAPKKLVFVPLDDAAATDGDSTDKESTSSSCF